jgi:hypothetical protein
MLNPSVFILQRSTKRTLLRIAASLLVGLLLAFSAPNQFSFFQTVDASSQSTFPNIISYRVNGAPNYTAPGSESFWRSINWTVVPLAATVSPGGGHTSNLLVKSANNGFDIYMLFRWNDSAGPSFLADPEMYRAPNGSLIPLTPEATANVTQLFYNSTYYYPDRVAVLWFIANQSERQESPRMMLGTNGAITGGAAEIWHWQSNPTDNNPNDTGFPGGYTNPTGAPIYPPDDLSFAEDDYTNTTGFFVIAGSFGSGSPNLNPYADPFIIHVGSYYSYSNKTWTVEMVRSFTTSQASSYRVQLATGSSYFIAMAVWQGKLGESAEFKSVSLWYNLTVSSHIAPSKAITASSPSSGVPISLASAVAVASVIVGLVIGTVLRSSSNSEKRSDKGGMKR